MTNLPVGNIISLSTDNMGRLSAEIERIVDNAGNNAAATIVNCVNPDGSLTPTYWEDNVFALPYRIKADRVIEREDAESSFSLDIKK